MKRFRFRLQKLLEVKQLREDLRKQELAAAQRALERERAELARLEAAWARALADLRDECRGTLDVETIRLRHRHLALLGRRMIEREAAVQRLAREEAARREALVEARRGRLTVERLKERAYARYRLEAARVEQAFLDEVGTTRYAREGGDDSNGSGGIAVYRAMGRG